MKCKKCGLEINPGEKFCRNCGSKVEEMNFIPNEVNNNYQSTNESFDNNSVNIQKPIDNEYLIRMYVGEKYEKFSEQKISLCTLFFGFIYMFCRKMWLYAIINWAIFIAIVNIFDIDSTVNTLLIQLLVNLGFAIFFKKLYFKVVTNRVEKLKSSFQGKTQDELRIICSKKGGLTLIPIIIVGVVYLLLMLFMFIFAASNLAHM